MTNWARRASADALGALIGHAVLAIAAAAAVAAPAGGEAPAAADSGASLEGLTIARVEVRTRNIFDPVPEGALSPIYRLGNRLHVRTRSSTVRHELLFAPGDPWSEERREESLRTLRTLDYLEPQRLEARREGDSVAVTVVTRDTWTTSPDFNLEHGGGQSFGTIGLTERNLFGLGKSVSAAYHEDPIGISRNLSFRDPAVGGSRVQLTYGAAAGVGGSTDLLSMGQPFYALDAPWAFGAAWLRSSSVLRLFQSGGEIANLDQRLHEGEAWVGRGFASDGTIVRPVLSLLIWDRDLGPSRLAPGAPPEFAGGDEKLRLRRVAVEMGMWKPNYVVREDVDRIGHAEDFDLGRSLGFKLGLSPRVLGSSVDEGYARIRGQVGAEGPLGFGYLQGAAAARMRRGPLEVLRQAEARWFVASRAGHVLVLAAHGTSGSRVARDYQVVVGGLSGLRAYPVQALAGRELVRLNAEQRWVLGRNLRDLVSIGTAVFYDAARAWGPGAAGTGWFNAAGFGLRLATPRTALGPVLRIDVAWPISPTRDGTREAVLSFGSSQAF